MIDPYLALGRPRIDITPEVEYLAGRTVLVTGAGGSIGSALCQRLIHCGIGSLVMLDRDESALHATQLACQGQALLSDGSTVLGDIRDPAWMRHVFARVRPDVVFHAAALKHQPILEWYPTEAIKTNIWGTMNVLAASARVGVEVLVNVSTDKAADPRCVLGVSKRVAERLTAWYRPERFLSVRFGNVFGSRGSVVGTFTWQIQHGLPVTVTSPEMQRYFLAPDEATDFLVHAGAIGRPGEVLAMDMGEPVRIDQLAERISEQLGAPARIVYTGARPGEKDREVILGAGESGECLYHPLITHVKVKPLSRFTLIEVQDLDDPAIAKDRLFDLLGRRAR